MNRLTDSEIYPLLASIPLFKGVNAQDLVMVQERVRLRRVIVDRGDLIVEQGMACRQLIILLEGRVRVTTESRDGNYTLEEWTEERQVIEIEQLYGLRQGYARTYRAETEVVVLVIEKDDIRRTLMHMDIWRINLLNMLCTAQTRYTEMVHRAQADTLEEMILRFVRERVLNTKGEKVLRITMSDLGRYMGATRLVISGALHRMEEQGLVRMQRNVVTFLEL